jgi:RNA polymerase sigma factor (sigma-70 family)
VTRAEAEWLAVRFEEQRSHLNAVAYRLLGSSAEAEDAVQETWLRLSRSDSGSVENLGSWLTTVVSRVCLNVLQQRRSRPNVPLHLNEDDAARAAAVVDPESEVVLADSIGIALLVVLDTLTPAERVAFVLHDMFAVPFEEIAPIVGRKPAATRQLASRARRRLRGHEEIRQIDQRRQSELVDAFLGAAKNGDFEGLLAVLDPEIVLRADDTSVSLGAETETRGADVVATFMGRARGAVRAIVDGAPGAVWMVHGRPRVVFSFTFADERIAAIDLIGDEDRLRELELTILKKEQSDRREAREWKQG